MCARIAHMCNTLFALVVITHFAAYSRGPSANTSRFYRTPMELNIDSPPTIEWVDDHIRIIDQTLLPGELRVIELRDVDEVVDAIYRLAVRGAPAIGACGAYGMVVALDEAFAEGPANSVAAVREILTKAADRIGNARPTAVNLAWAVNRVRTGAATGGSPSEIRRLALSIANAIFDEDRAACAAIGRYGAQELEDQRVILTHCNAGRLATTGIGTALGVVYGKALAGQPVEVFSSETRPLLQGARLTSWELSTAGIPVTVIPDSSASSLLASGRVDAVVVGSDRIAANGDVANKIGTLSHAIAARSAGVPFYVAAPTSTLDIDTPTGAQIEIEQRDAAEVEGFGDCRTTPAGVKVWNPAFDVTPADLVTAIITEVGVLRPDYTQSIAKALESAKLARANTELNTEEELS